ncbi:MAG: hypothetical protein AAGB32_01910 [Pseudomonadota bacterium]
MGKKKECSLAKAQTILNMIGNFRTTAKGDPNRQHFSPIVAEAVKSRAVTRDKVVSWGLRGEQASLALQSAPSGASSGTRAHVLGKIEERVIAIGAKPTAGTAPA